MERIPPKTAETPWEVSSHYQFTSATQEFQQSPSLASYARIYKEQKKNRVDVRYEYGERMFFTHQETLRKYGLLELAAAVFFRGNRQVIPELCMATADAILKVESDPTRTSFEPDLIEPVTVNWLINLMIDKLTTEPAMTVPPELHVLIKHSMKSFKPTAMRDADAKFRDDVIIQAKALATVRGETLTDQKLAEEFGLSKAHVGRILREKANRLELAIARAREYVGSDT